MNNCSKFVSDKTGSVVFVRKNNQIICSETWENAYRLIFQTKATVGYIDLDSKYSTTRVDAKADEGNFAITIFVPAECGKDSKLLEITYSLTDGISEREVYGELSEEIAKKHPIKPDDTTFFVSEIFSTNRLDNEAPIETGRLVNGTVDATQSNYATIAFVEISGNDGRYALVERANGTIAWNAYAFYDAEKNFISGNNYSGNTALLIPEGACYIRASGAPGSIVFVGINDTGEAMSFESYRGVAYIKPDYIFENNWFTKKKGAALGDSITANGGTYTTSDGRTGSAWREFVAQELKLSETIYNCGIGGSRVAGNSENAMWQDARINSIPNDSDVIFFNGGMNDWKGNGVLGEVDSTDTNTFYGALNTIVEKLYAKFPTKLIVFLTTTYGVSPVAGNTNPMNGKAENDLGLTQYDYGRCIKEVAEKKGIICVDLHALCGWNKYNISTYVNTEGDETSGLSWIHPNREGGKRIATAILSVLKSYQPFVE